MKEAQFERLEGARTGHPHKTPETSDTVPVCDCGHHFAVGDFLAVNFCLCGEFPDVSLFVGFGATDDDPVSGHDRFAKANSVQTHQVHGLSGEVRMRAEGDDAGHLGKSLSQEHSGKNRLAGEVSLKPGFTDGDTFHPDSGDPWLDVEDAIDENKWESMREDLENVAGFHLPFSFAVRGW